MNVKPILMSAPMVLATLREIEAPGTGKTKTRRIIKPHPVVPAGLESTVNEAWQAGFIGVKCPYGKPGDLLYVKETWSHTGTGVWTTQDTLNALDGRVEYRASNDIAGAGWFPSIFMFRKFSRLTLEITDVRVERLQDISEADARAEGINDGGCLNCGESEPCGCLNPQPDARDSFCNLWSSISGPDSWDVNPWVWVVSFRPHLINVDQFIREIV